MKRERNPILRLFMLLGPGLITGASDDDPSGIGTYSQAGASLGYATLWMAWLTFPLMAAVQYICAKVGLVTKRGLAGVLREHYPKMLLYPVVLLLLVANTINAGVDIGAIAAGLNLLIPVPIGAFVPLIVVLILALQIWGSYRLIARTFKWLTLALFAYIASAFCSRPDWFCAPQRHFCTNDPSGCGVPGGAGRLARHNHFAVPLFLAGQSGSRGEKSVAPSSLVATTRCFRRGAILRRMGREHWNAFLQCGDVFHHISVGRDSVQRGPHRHPNGDRCGGGAAAVGGQRGLSFDDVGAGGVRLPGRAYPNGIDAYAVCEAFGWKQGLNKKYRDAKWFYGFIVGATVVVALINYLGIQPITALYWTAILNGFLAPPLLVVIMIISNNKAVMGKRVNSVSINVLGWATTAAMVAAAAGLVIIWIMQA